MRISDWSSDVCLPISVFLRRKFPGKPFAGIDAQTGASNRIAVVFFIFAHVVVRAVVCDVKNFVRKRVGLVVSRARVLLPEFFMRLLAQPTKHRRLAMHVAIKTDCAQRTPPRTPTGKAAWR